MLDIPQQPKPGHVHLELKVTLELVAQHLAGMGIHEGISSCRQWVFLLVIVIIIVLVVVLCRFVT